MNFATFLKEAEELKNKEENNINSDPDESGNKSITLIDKLTEIINLINGESKKLKIFTIKDLYVLDYKSEDEEVDTKEIVGYFIYKNSLDKQDDYFIGRFVYDVEKGNLDLDIDEENKKGITTIADSELKLNKLKTTKFTIGK